MRLKNKVKRIQMLSSPGNCADLKEVILSLFGNVKTEKSSSLLTIEESIPDSETQSLYGVKVDVTNNENVFDNIKFSGYVSSCDFGCGRNSADRQFIYVNKRPVDFSKVNRIVNEVYGSFNRGHYCMLILFIDVDPAKLDVNVSPDKRTVFFQNEKELFAKLRSSLTYTFAKTNGSCHRGAAAISNPKRGIAYLSDSSIQKNVVNFSFQTQMSSDGIMDLEDEEFEQLNDSTVTSNFNLEESRTSNNQLNIFVAPEKKPNRKRRLLEDCLISVADSQNEHTTGNIPNESFGNENVDIISLSANLNSANICNIQSINDKRLETFKINLASSLNEFNVDKNLSRPTATSAKINSVASALSQSLKKSLTKTLESYAFKSSKTISESNQISKVANPALRCNENSEFISAALLMGKTFISLSQDKELPNPNRPIKPLEFVLDEDDAVAENGIVDLNQKSPINLAKEKETIINLKPADYLVDGLADLDSHEKLIDSASIEGVAVNNSITNETCPEMSESTSNILRPEQILEICSISKLKEMILRLKMLKKHSLVNKENVYCEIEAQPSVVETHNENRNVDEFDDFAPETDQSLNVMLTREDFAEMEVIGQFNNAFIFTRLKNEMFMIDQHASDEKFNFERFKRRAQIATQKLISSQVLELGAVEESVLRDNIDIFCANGFDFVFNDEAEVGRRVQLTSVPVLHGWQFNNQDIEEIIAVLTDFPGVMYRPAKLRKIFASRACRKSVMFGHALTRQQMQMIVCNMGTMDQPWNCPHGRPTIRHLCTINKNKRNEFL